MFTLPLPLSLSLSLFFSLFMSRIPSLAMLARIEAFIDSLNASGCSHGNTPPPVLVSTNVMEANQHDPLLSLTFELNPLTPKEEVKVDQRIILDVQPVQVVYDAVSLATSSAVLLLCCHCAVVVILLNLVLVCCCAVVVLWLSCCGALFLFVVVLLHTVHPKSLLIISLMR